MLIPSNAEFIFSLNDIMFMLFETGIMVKQNVNLKSNWKKWI